MNMVNDIEGATPVPKMLRTQGLIEKPQMAVIIIFEKIRKDDPVLSIKSLNIQCLLVLKRKNTLSLLQTQENDRQ